jgi:hypothetical protein
MKLSRLFFVLFLQLFFIKAYSQSSSPNADVIPKTFAGGPNTSALGRYGNYDVSYCYGLPSIDIPLYNIQVGNLELPISLNYHASGIKITDIASWVGLGWSLNCGGQISRSVMGASADESTNGYLRNNLRTNINTSIDNDLTYLNNVCVGNIDAEPDIFSYNLPGKSGKFFLNRADSFNAALIPYSPILIEKDFNSTTGKLWFNIVDEIGTKYSFGNSVKETTSGSNGGVAFNYTTGWMLENLISDNNRDTILISYNSQSSISNEDYSEAWGVDDNRNVYASDPGSGIPGTIYTPTSTAFLTTTNSSSSTNEQILSEIKYKNGKVTFTINSVGREDFTATSNTSKSLKSIQIYTLNYKTGTYDILKTVVLYQSYFIDGTDALTKRLKLDSVRILDKSNIAVETYRLNYNTAVALPRRTSKSRDYWGYFNGKANSTLIPQTSILYTPGSLGMGSQILIGSNVANSREPDSTKMQAAMLKRIYYPTGGYTDFEYETNRYIENDSIILAGGLRIKSIKSYDIIGSNPITKFYKYGENENGGGKKNFFLNDYNFFTAQTHRFYANFTGGIILAITKTRRTFISTPNIDILPYDAASVIYQTVAEYRDSLGVAGKTIYKFSDRSDALTSSSVAKPVKTSYFYARGQLLNKSIYKKIPTGYQPVQSEDYNYVAFPESLYNAVGLVVSKSTVNEGSIDNGTIMPSSSIIPNDQYSYRYGFYPISSDDNLLKSVVKKVYDDSDPSMYFSTTMKFEYNNRAHMKISKQTIVDSFGDTIITMNKFPADYISGNPVFDLMIARNMQNILVETYQKKIDRGSALSKTIGGSVNTYKVLTGGDIVLDAKKNIAIDRPISDFQPSVVSGSSFQFDSRYMNVIKVDSYNSIGKPVQSTAKTSPSSCSMWDYNNQYQIAVVVNASYSDIAYTSFEADGKGNFTFTGQATVDTTSPTGVKCYNLGQSSGSITSQALLASQTYTLSYWTKNPIPFTINGNNTGYPLKGLSYNDWTYYQHKISGVTTITLSGTGLIDELRLYPFTAQMITNTYAPGIGITGSCDGSGNLKFYEYDSYNRKKLYRYFKNIIETNSYNYKK